MFNEKIVKYDRFMEHLERVHADSRYVVYIKKQISDAIADLVVFDVLDSEDYGREVLTLNRVCSNYLKKLEEVVL